MTGRIKDHFWEQIKPPEYEPTPDDELEMLEIEAEQAMKRYAEALRKRNDEPR